ncbi:hypothetical protein D3C77_819940 [compost metagenome]
MVAVAIDKVAFFLRMRSPEQEHDAFAVFIQRGDHSVGKGFPAQFGMGVRLAAFNGQYRV